MNKVIRLLPNFVQFATLFFVMALYFRWDVSGFFENAEITIPAVLSLAFTLLTNGRSMHKDAISVLESENRHVQKEVERLQREVARLTKQRNSYPWRKPKRKSGLSLQKVRPPESMAIGVKMRSRTSFGILIRSAMHKSSEK